MASSYSTDGMNIAKTCTTFHTTPFKTTSEPTGPMGRDQKNSRQSEGRKVSAELLKQGGDETTKAITALWQRVWECKKWMQSYPFQKKKKRKKKKGNRKLPEL